MDSGLDDFDLAIVAIMPKKEARHLTKRFFDGFDLTMVANAEEGSSSSDDMDSSLDGFDLTVIANAEEGSSSYNDKGLNGFDLAVVANAEEGSSSSEDKDSSLDGFDLAVVANSEWDLDLFTL